MSAPELRIVNIKMLYAGDKDLPATVTVTVQVGEGYQNQSFTFDEEVDEMLEAGHFVSAVVELEVA